jgi:dihydrodipicolinate synthase/N-acetylneuraminate lyase
MKERWTVRGLIVSLNTPFDPSGRLDLKALERLVLFHLDEGAAGFVVPAQAAEVFELSFAERLALVETVRQTSRGHGIVIAGATSPDPKEGLAMAEHAVRLGCDGLLSEAPPGVPWEAAPLLEYFRRLADVGPPLLIIQDLDWRGPGLPVAVIAELFERIPSFRGLKVEVVPAGPKYTAVAQATAGRMHLSGGWAALQMIEALDRGVDVFMNTALTRFYRAVFDAYDAGDRQSAIERFHRLLPVLAFTRQHLDVSIVFHKRLFHHLGIFSSAFVRKRGVAWDKYFERQTVELLAYVDRLYQQEGIAPY